MASFVKTGEHYFKSLNVLKEKSDNFVRCDDGYGSMGQPLILIPGILENQTMLV